jgi:DNA-binding NarL/FixJ family response regulator
MQLITILVEDNKTIRDNLISAMAELAGVQVVAVAETASEAIAALQQHECTWQLAIVDLFLKEGSGLTVVRACGNRGAGQHVVVLTNYPTAEMRRRCLALGADAVFDKSNELEAFFELCNSYRWSDRAARGTSVQGDET